MEPIKPPAPDKIYEPPIIWYALVFYFGDNLMPPSFEIPFYFGNIGLKDIPGTEAFNQAIQEHYHEFMTDTHDPEQFRGLPIKDRYLYYIPFGENPDDQTDFEDTISFIPENREATWKTNKEQIEYLVDKIMEACPIIAMTKETMQELHNMTDELGRKEWIPKNYGPLTPTIRNIERFE